MSKLNIIKNISFLWMGSILGAGLAFLTQVYIARILGPREFGAFSSSLIFINILVPLAGFGIPQFWLRVYGSEGKAAVRWLRSSVQLGTICTIISLIIIILWSEIGNHEADFKKIIYLLTPFLVGQVALEYLTSKLQLEEKYISLITWQLLPHATRLILITTTSITMEGNADISTLGMIYAATGAVMLLIATLGIYGMRSHKFKPAGHHHYLPSPTTQATLKTAAIESAPFALAGIFHLIYFQGAIIFLKEILGSNEAGLYNAAFLIISGVYLFPSAIYQKYMLPKIHRWANHNQELYLRSYKVGNIYMLTFGGIFLAITWLLSPSIINTLFGEDFKESIQILKYLSLCIPIRFLATSVGSLLVTHAHMQNKVKIMFATALTNIALNLALIPEFGIKGALWATIICESMLLLGYYIAAKFSVLNNIKTDK